MRTNRKGLRDVIRMKYRKSQRVRKPEACILNSKKLRKSADPNLNNPVIYDVRYARIYLTYTR